MLLHNALEIIHMGLFKSLFRKRPTVDEQAANIVRQAVDVFQKYESLVAVELHHEMIERIRKTTQEFIDANQSATSGLTFVRLEAMMMALAWSIGLMVWEYWGSSLPEKDCVALAQANAIVELYQQQCGIPAGNKTFEWYNKAIAEQALATHASTPVVQGYMGQEDLARQTVAAILKAAKLPTDEEIIQAMERIGVGK